MAEEAMVEVTAAAQVVGTAGNCLKIHLALYENYYARDLKNTPDFGRECFCFAEKKKT